MITLRPAAERGHFDHGWLDTYHTFSFADYQDPQWMGFRALRVINDDVIAPDSGFGLHPHRDMEIISYVVSGRLAHRDTMNNGAILPAGGFQVMTAGSGLEHSEFNPSMTEPTRLLQIWIRPGRRGLTPRYQDRPAFPRDAALQLVAAPADAPVPGGTALPINQDAHVYHARLSAGESARHALRADRAAWVQIVDGRVRLSGLSLARGDGAAIEGVPGIELAADSPADLLLFDLA